MAEPPLYLSVQTPVGAGPGGAGVPPGLPGGLLSVEDMAGQKDIFFAATGVSAGRLLGEVRFWRGGATTHSVVMRSTSRTMRWLETHHRWENPGGDAVFQATG